MDVTTLASQLSLSQIAIGIGLSVILAAMSYRFEALSLSGAFGTTIVGMVIFGLGGLPMAVPLLFFFISSSLLSMLKSDTKLKSLKAVEKAGPRDVWQVMANGGVGTACVLIWFVTDQPIYIYLYVAAMCASTADTWATEIGTLYSANPVSIVSFKRVLSGQSGGVSVVGTAASMMGALTTAVVSYLVINDGNWHIWLICGLAGFAGSLVDSILGATIQAQYRCPVCESVTERKSHCKQEGILKKGAKIINNDMVNLVSNLAAVVAALSMIMN
ncbi:MAG: DUF92 domain-containing protein [candidate division Zixibacteria bacterium]|nr:DUF92 domain-containing protein [candidate division Zixibacteria bacterium]